MTSEVIIAAALATPLVGAVLIAACHRAPNVRETVTMVTAGTLLVLVAALVPTVLQGESPALTLLEIMPGLGLLTCGPSVAQAFNTMYNLELSCRMQVDAMAARTELTLPPQEVLDHTANMYQPGTRRPYGELEWHAMLRLLEAEEKSSGFPPYWH